MAKLGIIDNGPVLNKCQVCKTMSVEISLVPMSSVPKEDAVSYQAHQDVHQSCRMA